MKKYLAALLCLALVLCCFSAIAEKQPITFTFFQMEGCETEEIGDSCLIQFPNGETMLVDTLVPECGEKLVRSLQSMGVEHLDALLLTHMHIDHIGGVADVLRSIPTLALYGPDEPYSTATYKNYTNARQAAGLTEQRLQTGDTLSFGDVTIKILHPVIDEETHKKFADGSISVAETNQYSIVFLLTYGDFTALFTGDIYQVTEKALVKTYGDGLSCDLLKIPHHADGSSSSTAFIQAASPKVAVATGNIIPANWLYKRYLKEGTSPYLTLIDGTVTVTAFPDGQMQVNTQYERDKEKYPLPAQE